MQLPALLVADLDHRHAEPAENVEIHLGVATHVRQGANDKDRCVDAALKKRSRNHEAVAAIVPAAAQDGDPAVQT